MNLIPPPTVFPDGFTPVPHPPLAFDYTERELVRVLHTQLSVRGWAMTREVPAPPHRQGGREVSRRADVVALRADGEDVTVAVVEIKRTRQDFLADVRNPDKQEPWRQVAHLHYYAAPAGVIPPAAVPSGSGLLEVTRRQHPLGAEYDDLVAVTPAPVMPRPSTPPAWLVTHLAEQVSWLTGRWEGWAPDSTPQEVDAARLRTLERDLHTARAALDKARSDVKAWRALAVTQGLHLPCQTCGQAVVPERVTAGAFTRWRHAQPAPDCPATVSGVTPRDPEGPPA